MTLLRFLRVVASLFLLASIILAALVIQQISTMGHSEESANSAILNYALAQRSLQLDLLDERAGLIRNYDPVNSDLDIADKNLDLLQRSLRTPALGKILQELITENGRQEQRVEEFNSDNALLQNALLYLTEISNESPGMQLLINRMLKLTLDTSPSTVEEATNALRLMSKPPDDDHSIEHARSIAYARLLVEVLPEIDGSLAAIRASRIESLIDELRSAVTLEATSRLTRIHALEFSLTSVAVLLTGALFALFVVQYTQTRELQAQAATERLSAAIAMPLLDTGSGPFVARVEESTQRLGYHVRARRLQLTIPGIADCSSANAADRRLDPEWLPRLVHAADLDDAWRDDRIVVSLKDGAPRHLARVMRDLSLEDVVLLRVDEPFPVLFGFEPEDRALAQRRDYLAGLSSAIIAVAHGARREVMQLERESLEETLARMRRMEKLGAIASGVAHNFNNIIGAISGFAEIGQERTARNSAAYGNFTEIRNTVARAHDLVSDILDYAKQGLSIKAPIDLHAIVSQAARMHGAAERRAEAVTLAGQSGALAIFASRNDIQQVCLNIFNNASQASGGAPIDVTIEHHDIQRPMHLSHGELPPGLYAVVSITDRGPGITETALNRLFEPFFTTKAMGTGLGLSTAWEIVRAHAGAIDVRNAPAGGAVFRLWLPALSADPQGGLTGNGARVALITEPDRITEEEEMIAALGYEPLACLLTSAPARMQSLIEDADVILVATWRTWMVDDLVQSISSTRYDRPLLLATPRTGGHIHRFPHQIMAYPVRADQLLTALRMVLA